MTRGSDQRRIVIERGMGVRSRTTRREWASTITRRILDVRQGRRLKIGDLVGAIAGMNRHATISRYVAASEVVSAT